LLEGLLPHAEAGLPIVCIEPSCCSSLTDDLPDLMDDEDAAMASTIANRVSMLDQFLAEAWQDREPPQLKALTSLVLLHGHCHQKALYGTAAMKELLKTAGVGVEEVDAGCCGMAGAFGYQHHDLSMQIAESRLFPAIREWKAGDAEAGICAPGLSCRHQIADGLDLKAKHWLECFSPA
jgi:Fe-S oxidoreductase